MRVLGCLIEKQRTTPDAYPLTLNSLRLACNQSTNRDPVLDLGESEIRAALERLGQRRWTRLASWSSGRSMKYRHMLGETLDLDEAQVSLLAVLMLRGAQTPGELRQRTERMHRFGEDELEATLDGARGARARSPAPAPARPARAALRAAARRGVGRAAGSRARTASVPAAAGRTDGLDARVERLESELAALREELRALREELGA